MTSQIHQLNTCLPQCLSKDRFKFKTQLQRLGQFDSKNAGQHKKLAHLNQAINQSIAMVKQRQASIPKLNFPDLPVSSRKQEIADLIKQHQVLILCGETGSGKTTQLPKICLSIGRGSTGFIGHTQPRRIAARTVADRVAEELGETLGNSVGFKIRFHDQSKPQSLIKIMTDGILLAETQNDPYLNQYDTLIIDEAHERSLNIDFMIGYLKWLLPQRPDLKIIITSATIDPECFAKHFNKAPIIEVSGRSYPVEVRYRPIQQLEEDDETSGDLQQAIIAAVDDLQRDIRGDILIFLNGQREIRETADSLRKFSKNNCEILPLYSKLSMAEQQKVFKSKGQMRIVLATNVAETSLTVPGIRCVIDVGHARISRYSHRSKIQRLPIEKISQASANQRAGRCGRVAEGICIRLYSEEDYLARPEFTEPEILRTNLASVILQMHLLKLGNIDNFPFIDPPSTKMIRDGIKVLHEICALDNQQGLTDQGRQLARLPIDPRLGRMLLAAAKNNSLTEVAIIVSGLSIQDPREKPADKMPQAEAKHRSFRVEQSDFLGFLKLWQVFEQQRQTLSSNKLRKYCRENFISYIRMREWRDVHSQILRFIKEDLKLKSNQVPANYQEIHQALIPGLLSNLGFRHEQYEYLGARNLKFFIFPGSAQHKLKPKWIISAEQVETSKVYARNVAKVEPDWIEQAAQHLLKRSYHNPHWEKKSARSVIYERTILYGLTLQTKRKIPYEKIDPVAAREMFIRSALVQHDYQTHAPFFKANQALLKEVGYVQHKGRRVDLVEDEAWLYQFYDNKIPAEVVNAITLDKWRNQVEKTDARLLYLRKEDLIRAQDGKINDKDFPDHLALGDLSIELSYRFEPGHEDDGVTVVIPVHQLNQLNQLVFDWLIPGLLEDKLIALLKALPKTLRKYFVPIPTTVSRCLELEAEQHGDLFEWLSKTLRHLTGEAIPVTEWHREQIAEHLKMNFRVIDDKGKILGQSRDLKKLQHRFKQKSVVSFEHLAAVELNYTGCIQWVFDDLPKNYQFNCGSQELIGYPAIIDEGNSIGLRIIDTETEASIKHQDGLLRLLQLSLAKEVKYLQKNAGIGAQLEVSYNRLASQPLMPIQQSSDCQQDLIASVFNTVFLSDNSIRTKQEFEHCLSNKNQLVTTALSVAKLITQILESHIQLNINLQKMPAQNPAVADMKMQLFFLIYQGFIRNTPYQHLQYYPRYLQAIQYRLDKLNHDKQRDTQKQADFNHYWERYWTSVENRRKYESVRPTQENFRWALEEFKVSLFAQKLKTAYPISAKRLEKIWDFS